MSINYSVYLICSRGWQDSNLRPSDSLLYQLSYTHNWRLASQCGHHLAADVRHRKYACYSNSGQHNENLSFTLHNSFPGYSPRACRAPSWRAALRSDLAAALAACFDWSAVLW